ncbi:hypothetical protein E9840_03020 [Tissierella creatinini]|nr:hypothetical protein E9840_03020 [Tissierella creatinini]TJX67247.1 hypothetical protein E8P77_05565 [Soehngenia saccharolytica]
MKKFDLKKIFTMVAGALIIALVVSIVPGGFLASAAEISKEDAEQFALDVLKDEDLIEDDDEVTIKRTTFNRGENIYTIIMRTDDFNYELVVDANDENGNVLKILQIDRDDNTETIIRDLEKEEEVKEAAKKEPVFEEFNDFENMLDEKKVINKNNEEAEVKYLAEDEYLDHGEDKPTPQAELNEVLRDAKKAAINEFKEAEDKVEAKEDFKEAKDLIKEVKKATKDDIKVNKNASEDEDDEDEDTVLIQKVKLTEDQALSIALKSVGLETDSKGLDNESVELDDDNPPVYEVKFTYTKDDVETKYEFRIHAQSGKILDVEKEVKEVKQNNSNSNTEKSNNSNKNKEKSNNGKGNK